MRGASADSDSLQIRFFRSRKMITLNFPPSPSKSHAGRDIFVKDQANVLKRV